MKKKAFGAACGVLFCLGTVLPGAYALELRTADLSASVEVLPAFSVSLTNVNLGFGTVSPGTTKVLGEGRFYNELKCRSNTGRTWQATVHISSFQIMGGTATLPFSNLKFKIAEYSGSTQPVPGPDFQPFSDQPALLYVSQGDDQRGREVVLRFQYSLYAPGDIPSGTYVGSVYFTLTETP